ncbi:unnamed protein product [Soboliphyme baturini]|uniref:Rab-GAP TBC domain-containing protein n=1 Tax=Soboliphyme baturini TaxID=241478 RepID=A0A183JAC0_9BILA|nr:unnamed protein product [Soboliphyme baturini]
MKWLDMFKHWPDYMNRHFDKVKSRCRKGIPPSVRAKAWKYMCGAQYLMTSPSTMHLFEVSSVGGCQADLLLSEFLTL